MTCDEYAAMMATKAACSNNGGMWNEVTCIYPTATDETKCTNAGYIWVKGLNGGCHFNNNSSGGSSGSPAAIGGVSANEKLNERIESQCLAHVANSGYKETLLKEGLFEIIRIYATNACTLAYFATNGKYSSNQDLFLIPRLIMNDEAKMQEDIGILYQALEDVPARKDGQLLDDYLNPDKDGAAGRLKAIMDIMAEFNDLTANQKLNPSYLTEPMPYVMKDAAAQYNAKHDTKIVSLEEKFFALLPKPEEVIEKPKEPEKIIEEFIQPTTPAIAIQSPESEASQSRQTQATKLLTNIKNLFKEIRDAVIARAKISRSTDIMRQDIINTQKVIQAFKTCLNNGICSF